MIRTSSFTIACAVALLLPGQLTAQRLHVTRSTPTPGADRIGTHLDWVTIDITMYPTNADGMELNVATTAEAGRAEPFHSYVGYAPDSVLNWVNSASALVHAQTHPASPQSMLLSPALRSLSGDSIRLLRRAQGRNWEKAVLILIDRARPRGSHLDILARPPQVDSLLKGLLREAALSHYDPDSVAASTSNFAALDSVPVLLQMGSIPQDMTMIPGEITASYLVDEHGMVDTTTLVALATDHGEFVHASRLLLAHSRFRPAYRYGVPVPLTVQQIIRF